MTDPLQPIFERALALQQQGRLDDAEQAYREISAAAPGHFLARFNLGVLLYSRRRLAEAEQAFAQAAALMPLLPEATMAHAKVLQDLGRNADAVGCYKRLLALKPDHANAWCDLGSAEIGLGQIAAALQSFDRCLTLKPDHLIALFNRATSLMRLNREPEALDAIGRAVALKPDFVEALQIQGTLLRNLGRGTEALACFDAVLRHAPGLAEGLNNRGTALLDLGRLDEALASFDAAVAAKPAFAEALANRGRVFGRLGRSDEELAAYDAAIAARPDFAEAYTARGNFLLLKHRLHEAERDLRHTLALKPGQATAAHALGNLLMMRGDREGALAAFNQAVTIQPDYVDALINRGVVLRALNRQVEAGADFRRVLELRPDAPLIPGSEFTCRVHACDWTDFTASVDRLIAALRQGKLVDNPFSLLAYAQDPADQLRCAELYLSGKPVAERPPPRSRAPVDKIRIAYVTADLHNHATAYLMAGLWEAHDRARFEIHGVSLSGGDGTPVAARARRGFDSLLEVQESSDDEIVRRMRAAGIDIAVDLKGFTKDARPSVFLARPAPVQAAFLGYPGTFGHSCMDYIIADRTILPPEHQIYFAEKVAYLPDCYQPNDRARVISQRAPTRAEAGLPPEGFVFCSFNGNYKITPEVFDAWMRLLAGVPGSVLWLFRSNHAAEANLRREAETRGIDSGRLVFAPVMASADHLARHRLADLFLDTLPVNAHTTASDALWAGLPVVTCQGQSFIGRVAASVLKAAGLPELITENLADYEALALKLALDRAALAAIKAKLAATRETCTLFDTDRFRKHIEAAYVMMWERHRRGEPPVTFEVPAIA